MGGADDLPLLFRQVRDGKDEAVRQLFARVYDELRVIAGAHFRDQPAGHTLQPTILVHEAFARMVGASSLEVRDRTHFFALASTVMRQLLVDHGRARRAAKRGAGWARVTLSGVRDAPGSDGLDVLDLDEALDRLAGLDPRKARVVELRFFGGLETSEVARVLDVSPRTVESDWAMARAWLKRELE